MILVDQALTALVFGLATGKQPKAVIAEMHAELLVQLDRAVARQVSWLQAAIRAAGHADDCTIGAQSD